MKKLLLIMLTALLAPVALSGQNKEINDLFDKYEKKRSVESVVISPPPPPPVPSAGKNSKDKDAQEWMSKITEMRILTVGSGVMENNVPVRQSLKADMEKLISTFNFSRLLKVKDSGEEVELYVNKNKTGVLLFLNSSTEEYTVIAMFGNIDDNILKSAMSGGIHIK